MSNLLFTFSLPMNFIIFYFDEVSFTDKYNPLENTRTAKGKHRD